MRKDIINIVNKLALKSDLGFYLMETYNAILKYCKENKKRPRSNEYELINGCLYINNEYIRRVDKDFDLAQFDLDSISFKADAEILYSLRTISACQRIV